MGWSDGTERIIGHGSVPPPCDTADPSRVLIDVTDAARRWQRDAPYEPVILVWGPRTACTFHGASAAQPAVRPALRIVTERGLADIPCVVSDEILPGAGCFRLGGGSVSALRFAPLDRGAHIVGARLVLTVKTQAGVSPEPVYAAERASPDALPSLAGRDLWSARDLYFRTQAVGVDPRSDSAFERNLRHQVTHPPQWKQASWSEEDGEPFLRIHWSRSRRSGSFKVPIFHPASKAEGRIVAFQYDVRVAENFSSACSDGGKFPGYCSSGARYTSRSNPWPDEPDGRRGTLAAGNGGDNVHGDDGWSARGGYLRGISLKTRQLLGYVPLHTYSYHLSRRVGDRVELWHEALRRYEEEKGLRGKGYVVRGGLKRFLQPGEYVGPGANPTGARLRWDYGPSEASLLPGRWHRIAQVMRINDPDALDGRIDAYLDGRQVARIEGVRWRTTREPRIPNSTLGIGAVWFNFYHGGTGYPVADTTIDVKRVAVQVLEWEP